MATWRLLLQALFISFSVAKGMAESGIILKLKSGATLGFTFLAQPKVEMGSELTITDAGGVSVSYNYAEVTSLSWGEVESLGIENAKNVNFCDVVFNHTNDVVSVIGLPKGAYVSIYTVGGSLIRKRQSDGSILNVTLPYKGLYIVSTSTGASYKIMNL